MARIKGWQQKVNNGDDGSGGTLEVRVFAKAE
jgi:hypothetical protein